MSDGQFTWSEEDDAYIASQDTFDWWAKYIGDSEATDAEVAALADKLNIEHWIIRERIGQHIGADGDYEMHRRYAVSAMREIEEEYAQ